MNEAEPHPSPAVTLTHETLHDARYGAVSTPWTSGSTRPRREQWDQVELHSQDLCFSSGVVLVDDGGGGSSSWVMMAPYDTLGLLRISPVVQGFKSELKSEL